MTNAQPRSRILAVDDTHANLVALEAVLGRSYDLVLAHSGREALSLLERGEDVDVILMDVQMPMMDGYETAERIKRIAGCEEIPLIFITAIFTEDPAIKKGYAVGAVDYFTKPFDPDVLKLKVDVYATFRRRAAVLKERERQLRESEAVLRAARRLSATLEALPVGVAITDASGRICQTNETMLRLLNAADAVDNGSYGEALEWWQQNEQALKQPGSPLARAIDSGEATHGRVITLRAMDGTTRQVLESTSPLRAIDSTIVGAVIVVQDLTERTKVASEFEDQIAKLVSVGVELDRQSANPQG